jgi:AraC-like DNA-binding protein
MGYKTLSFCEERDNRSAVGARFGESTRTERPIDWRVERILQFLDTHDGKLGWGLNHLCLHLELGITGPHAAKLFSRQTGIGIREYAKERRLTVAAQQLRGTTDSVKQIALELGYRTPNDLRRQFKKRFSLNPTEFRTAHHQTAVPKQSGVLPFPDNLIRLKGAKA